MNSIIRKAKQFWRDNYSDEFGYVTEKIERLDSLHEDEAWIAYNMFDFTNQSKFKELLTEEEIEWLNNNL